MLPRPARPAVLAFCRIRHFLCVAMFCALFASRAAAQSYDPPANYYSTATGTGATLKANLNNIIDGHTVISYSAVTTAFGVTDVDPNNSNNLLTVYDRTSISKVYSTNPLVWNREHTWPRSRGIEDSGPDDSDLFNLRPALTQGNGDRQNFNFGGAYNSQSAGLVTAPSPDEWYPGNADAGMIARQEFYMAVRYDGNDASTTDLELVSGNPAATASTLGDLDRLLEWHYAAVPDTFERRRNQVIYDQYQHNRDPFIDHPEWVWSVFKNQANDTGLTLNGGSGSATPGSTNLNVDLGRRLVGSALPADQAVIINKTGVDGTYYSVTAAGSATSSVTGPLNAFTIGAAGSKSINVGLAAGTSTATAGLRSGTVTIDNLDITTAGGSGKGANDGNDVITVNLSVLDHANASFAGVSDLNTLTLDLGTVTMGATAPTLNFSIFDLNAPSGFTAGLDLDTIVGSGSTSVLSTNLAPFSGASTLAAGQSRSFTASMNTSTVGSFSATYTLGFSDENLTGATSLAGLTLTLNGIIAPAAVANADFDNDGDVDGLDFSIWQGGLGLTANATRLDGDANGDHMVNALDLGIWRAQFGTTPPLGGTVPEPATATLLLAGALFLATSAVRRPTAFASR